MGLSDASWAELDQLSQEVKSQRQIERERDDLGRITKHVSLYVCPTPGCPQYYGADGMPDLSTSRTGDRGLNGEEFGRGRTLDVCPECYEQGRVVKQVRVAVTITLPQ